MPFNPGGGGASGANPTATISATAGTVTNGAAATFMRSDGAPALPATIAGLNSITSATGQTLTLATLDGNTDVVVATHGTGRLRVPAGSVSLPAISPSGVTDPTTGIFFTPASSLMDFVSAGTSIMRIRSGKAQILGTAFIEFGATAAASIKISADATSADLVITTPTTGVLKLATASNFTANATTACALTAVGPAGANTTVQEWLTFKNAGGTVRYVPCF